MRPMPRPPHRARQTPGTLGEPKPLAPGSPSRSIPRFSDKAYRKVKVNRLENQIDQLNDPSNRSIYCIACRLEKPSSGAHYGSIYSGITHQSIPVIDTSVNPPVTLSVKQIAYPSRQHGMICLECQSDYLMINDSLGSHRKVQLETSFKPIIDDPMTGSRADQIDLLKSSNLIPKFHGSPIDRRSLCRTSKSPSEESAAGLTPHKKKWTRLI